MQRASSLTAYFRFVNFNNLLRWLWVVGDGNEPGHMFFVVCPETRCNFAKTCHFVCSLNGQQNDHKMIVGVGW